MKSEGSAGHAVMGSTHLPLPMYGTTRKSAPPKPTPTGLDWDALRPAGDATAAATRRPKTRSCKGCGNATPVAELRDHHCPVCAAAAEDRFHGDHTELGRELAALEVTEPEVAEAVRHLEDVTDRIVNPDDYTQPPASDEVEKPATGPDLRMAIAHLRAARDGLVAELHRIDVTLALLLAESPADPRPAPVPTPRPAAPQTRRRRPSIDTADVVRRYQNGDTAPTIGAALGLSPKRVREALDDAGVQRRDDRATHSGSRKKTAADDDPYLVATVRRLYLEEQLTLGEVGQQIGQSQKGVQGIAERHGIPLRPAAAFGARNKATKISAEQRDEIARRYRAGESLSQLAIAYEVSTPTIVYHLEAAGVARRPRGGAPQTKAARG